MAFMLALALAWLLWETQTERIDYGDSSGIVEDVVTAQTAKGMANPVVTLRLPNGKRAKLMLSKNIPLPKKGERVPLSFEDYDDGSTLYWFNEQRWLIEGGR